MNLPEKTLYLAEINQSLRSQWPENRVIHIVCHGHSVPAGYFAAPMVDTFNAYPHLLHIQLKNRFPFALINVIVTAKGGENSKSGAVRFADEVLCHRPDVITIDYGLNDRGIGLEEASHAWKSMIRAGLDSGSKIILLTPTMDLTQAPDYEGKDREDLAKHANQIRGLATGHGIGLADSFRACHEYMKTGHLTDILSGVNHPNRRGHELVVRELLRWFPAG